MYRQTFETLALLTTVIGLVAGCDKNTMRRELSEAARIPAAEPADASGDRAETIEFLKQNWSPEETLRFYSLPHGSQLIPYQWFLHLEQPGKTELVRSDANMRRLRFLPQKAEKTYNPDALPVGFAKDGDLDWVGLNCAACHTTQINFKGKGIRVDGAPSMADLDTFLRELTAALQQTHDDQAVFDRFAKNVLGNKSSKPSEVRILRQKLKVVLDRRTNYNERNLKGNGSTTRPPWGFGRIDAFGVILNQVTSLRLQMPDNSSPANAPVSIPFLWDTPAHEKLQWNGAASNSKILGIDFGALGRNVGEVLGVFGEVRIEKEPLDFWPGYESSVRFKNLNESEKLVSTLWSPLWPGQLFKHSLDTQLVAKGREVYKSKKCVNCHVLIDRTTSKPLEAAAQDKPIERMITIGTPDKPSNHAVGTDPKMAANFDTMRDTGPLFEKPKNLIPATEAFETNAKAGEILAHVVIGTIIHGPANEDQELPLEARFELATAEALKYKARPLNGIWATAPYLHNGSVPNLHELLLPVGKRSTMFVVGQREFDPDRVGFKQFDKVEDGVKLGFFCLDTAVDGNSNSGHVYGAEEFEWIEDGESTKIAPLTDDERKALLEFLRSL